MSADPVLRLLCLSPYMYDSAPNMRFRFEQWAPGLGEQGIELEFLHFAHATLDEAARRGDTKELLRGSFTRYPGWMGEVARRVRGKDAVIVPIKAALAGPPLIEALLHRFGVPFVYDVDDGHHLGNPGASWLSRALIQCPWRVPWLGEWAGMVSVGNEELARYYRGLNAQVRVWPTTVTMSRYIQRPPPPPGARLIVGWTGSPHTAMYLQQILPLVAKLQQTVAFDLFVFGAQIDLGAVRGWCEPWTRAREVAALHQMDVGLMPLTDDPWSRCKCGFKAIQYLATGVPALVSDVGVNAQIVRDGSSGYVIRTPQQWYGALGALLTDPEKRARFGLAGRAHISASYSSEARVPQIAQDLRAFVGRATPP